MEEKIKGFRDKIVNAGIVDGEGIHHAFSQGLHGQKIDFSKIPKKSKLFDEWADLSAEYIKANYSPLPEVIVGVAYGANHLVAAIADRLGDNVIGLISYKPGGAGNQPVITDEAKQKIQEINPELVLLIEDVGTMGTNSQSTASSVRRAGVNRVEVLNTWQRSETLEQLDQENIPYKSIIKEQLTNYTPEACQRIGFCSKGWKLAERGR